MRLLAFLLAAVSTVASLHGRDATDGVFADVVKLEKVGCGGVRFELSLDELVSAAGEEERYAPCDARGTGVEVKSLLRRRPDCDAYDAYAAVSNRSGRVRFLRLVFRADIPFAEHTFWNGYLNQANNSHTGEGSICSFFPAIAAISTDASLVLGLDPMMLAARVDTSCENVGGRKFLEFAFPVYLPPEDGFEASMTLASAPSRYLWHDVVEKWYELFPKAFAVADGVHPGVRSAEASYMFWKPSNTGISNEAARASALRERFGDRPCWDWCYKPFIRGGDWAISDRWSVGWRGYSAERVAAVRKDVRRRLAEGEPLNVAPMWYLNVCWTERDMGIKEFPGVLREKPIFRRCWGQDTVRPIYCAGGTPYEKLFRESLERIAREYPEAKGIGWDSCFANIEIQQSHIGFDGTPCKSFRKGRAFVHEAVGISGLLDFNHTHFAGPHRMANAVNYKLVAPWMIGVRTDTGLYEGTPMTRPERFWRLESLRARLGPKKVLAWHKGCDMKTVSSWAKLDKMTHEERMDAHRQIMDDNLFLCYYWGTVPAAAIPSENSERLVGALGELIDLITSGWHPSPACDAPDGILVSRYGDGTATRLAVINPGFESRDVELLLPKDYWPQYKDGRKIAVSIPARQVMIVDPFTSSARPAATVPPHPVRKVFRNGLMPWMARSGLLGFSSKKGKGAK